MALLRLLMITAVPCLLLVLQLGSADQLRVQQSSVHPPPNMDSLLSTPGVDDTSATVKVADWDESEDGLAPMQFRGESENGLARSKFRYDKFNCETCKIAKYDYLQIAGEISQLEELALEERQDRMRTHRTDDIITTLLRRPERNEMLDVDELNEQEGQLAIIPTLTHDEVARSQWEGRERVVKYLVVIGLILWLIIFRNDN